jgi:hypothetical protein
MTVSTIATAAAGSSQRVRDVGEDAGFDGTDAALERSCRSRR